MAGDIEELIRMYKAQIEEERRRLEPFLTPSRSPRRDGDESINGIKHPVIAKEATNDEHQQDNKVQQSNEENKENQPLNRGEAKNQKVPLIEPLVLSRTEGDVGEFENSNVNTGRRMLRYGEYSPNNPQLRVSAAPYLGLGEYDQRRDYLLKKRRNDYLDHLAQMQYESASYTPQDDLNPYLSAMQNSRLSYQSGGSQNALLKPDMEKPKSILSNRRTGSPRERLLSDLKHSYTPSFMEGFSYHDRSEELEREKMKRETYQRELRLQIEEKRRLQAMRDEQERREQELENKRLEQQLLRMQEEQMIEEQRRCHRDEQRRHSATQQDLSKIRRSPKLQRRSSSSRFEDSLPVPVLKAHSPVAKELRNSVPFNSRRGDDKWQIPTVQKTTGDSLRDGQGRSILTQLGAIRLQLQKEQMRMDELLRQRDFTQSKAVDFH